MSGANDAVRARLADRYADVIDGYALGVVIDDYAHSIAVDTRAIVRSDERVLLIFLTLLSVVALAVFLHYTLWVLDGLPEVPLTPVDST